MARLCRNLLCGTDRVRRLDNWRHIILLMSSANAFIADLSPFFFWFRSFLLTIIVEKSKMCLDFSVTYFLIHLLISSFYYRVPATADWWIVHVFAMIVMVLVGEYLCSLRELSDIPLLQIWQIGLMHMTLNGRYYFQCINIVVIFPLQRVWTSRIVEPFSFGKLHEWSTREVSQIRQIATSFSNK